MRNLFRSIVVLSIISFLLPLTGLHAQSVGVNFNGAAPNSAAAFDIDVTALSNPKKGMLIPRMTSAERLLITLTAPAQGLIVYQTDLVQGFYYNTSLTTTPTWVYLSPGGGGSVNGTAGQVAFFNGATSITSNASLTYNSADGSLTELGTASGGVGIFGSNSSNTAATVGMLGVVNGNGVVSGVQGQALASITTSGASGVSGFALGTSGNTYGVFGQTNSPTGYGVYGYANASQGLGVVGSSQIAGAAGFNAGVIGLGTNNSNLSIGVDGETNTANGYGVRGLAIGTTAGSIGVYGQNTSTVGSTTYGMAALNIPIASAGATHIGLQAQASGAQTNIGLAVGQGETVITNSNTVSNTAQLPRSFGGSIFTQVGSLITTGGRLWWGSDGYVFYVNSTNSADYSEFFKTSDQSLGVGEVVALDPENASGVRRARPSDAASTVGIVSIAGMRYNDNRKGNRGDDPNYANIGMIGQVPVLITTENGDIKPGDALTLSAKYRGRAVKATGPCRIIGYATTHFPYVAGEKDYEEDIAGGDKMRLSADHVMCYLNVGWYSPTTSAGDGIELPKVESAQAMMKRLNTTLATSGKLKTLSEIKDNTTPSVLSGSLPKAVPIVNEIKTQKNNQINSH
jgi:hypothetical protein